MSNILFLVLYLKVLFVSSFGQPHLETVEAVVGYTAELPCNVTAEKEDSRLDILAWYKNASTASFYSSDFRNENLTMDGRANGRFRLILNEENEAQLQISPVVPSDEGVYCCVAEFNASPTRKTYVQVAVIEPVQNLWVIHENGTRVAMALTDSNVSKDIGPYYVEDTLHLYCVSFEGKPMPTLSWWAGQQLLKSSSTPLTEQRLRSELHYGPLTREDHGLVLSCNATNTQLAPPLFIDITINMYLPPELVSLRSLSGSGRTEVGAALALQCRVLGATPLPHVAWRIHDRDLDDVHQNINKEPSQRLLTSDINLQIERDYDEKIVTCCVPAHRRDSDAMRCAQGLPLTVFYPPVLEIAVEKDIENNTMTVLKGSNVSMNCSYQANPPINQLYWFHENDIVSNNSESLSEDIIEATLNIINITEADVGEYVCGANNDKGFSYSHPINIDVVYPSYCQDESIAEYGVAEGESINLTCVTRGSPAPESFRWVVVGEAVDLSTFRPADQNTTVYTEEDTLLYQRPNDTAFITIFCWGVNGIESEELPSTPCSFLVTDETVPRPPARCSAAAREARGRGSELAVTCLPGHDGGLAQKFTFSIKSDTGEELMSIVSKEPTFMIQEPEKDNYTMIIYASNAKGNSKIVEIHKEDVINSTRETVVVASAVSDISTLALCLCGGVLLVALAACGLVLCARERAASPEADLPRARHHRDPPLTAYNTEDSHCETYDSDESECNVRRTESFRRAMSRYPSQNYDVRRTSSFHSARYMNDAFDETVNKYNDKLRHGANCRLHSLQNISRKRDMDNLCDHLVTHLPPEITYNVQKPMNTFYTMPRRIRQKLPKEFSDETSEVTQTSDGFSLPPPPDEFTSYRAGVRIKDVPVRAVPTYSIVNKSNKDPRQNSNVKNISSMNMIGIPPAVGQTSVYTYPDDDHLHNTNPFEDS